MRRRTAVAVAAGTTLAGACLYGTAAVVCSAAILIHEAGHALFLRLCGVSSWMLVTPWLGLTVGDIREDAEDLPLTARGHGWFLLSGCLLSLGVVLILSCVVPLSSVPFSTAGEFVFYIIAMCLFLNVVNLFGVLPLTDGGRLLLMLCARRGASSPVAAAVLTAGGIGVWRWATDWISTGVLLGLSMLAWPWLREGIGRISDDLTNRERAELAAAYAVTALSSLCLLRTVARAIGII